MSTWWYTLAVTALSSSTLNHVHNRCGTLILGVAFKIANIIQKWPQIAFRMNDSVVLQVFQHRGTCWSAWLLLAARIFVEILRWAVEIATVQGNCVQ